MLGEFEKIISRQNILRQIIPISQQKMLFGLGQLGWTIDSRTTDLGSKTVESGKG